MQMLLRLTIDYFDGKARDTLNFTGLTLEAARARRNSLLNTIQDCITKGQMFYIAEDAVTLALAPSLLMRSHFKFEIVEE